MNFLTQKNVTKQYSSNNVYSIAASHCSAIHALEQNVNMPVMFAARRRGRRHLIKSYRQVKLRGAY